MFFFLSSFCLIDLPFLTQVLDYWHLGSGEACTCLLIVLITISFINMSKDKIKSVYLNVCVSMFCKIMTCQFHSMFFHRKGRSLVSHRSCSDKRFIQAIILLNCRFCLPINCVHNWSFLEMSLTFISPKPIPKPSDVQLLSTRHVTKVHLLQKFLDPQKYALIDNILPTCGNLSRFSFTWKMCVQRKMYIHFN
jgi:hypothetical protein